MNIVHHKTLGTRLITEEKMLEKIIRFIGASALAFGIASCEAPTENLGPGLKPKPDAAMASNYQPDSGFIDSTVDSSFIDSGAQIDASLDAGFAQDAKTADELACDDVLSEGDTFALGSSVFEYIDSDRLSQATPKLKIRSYDTGDFLELAVRSDRGSAFATLSWQGIKYVFTNASDPSMDDWDIGYVCNLDCNTTLAKNDHFVLSGKPLRYRGSDRLSEVDPKALVKDITNGETIQRSVDEPAIFAFNMQGIRYLFRSVSDFNMDDYDIRLVIPCDLGLDCGTDLAKNDYFMLNGLQFQYKGADGINDTSPRAKIKNVAAGEVIERSTGVNTIFTLDLQGNRYVFEAASDTSRDDYDVRLLAPCN